MTVAAQDLPVQSQFPDHLTSRRQWLVWRFVLKPGQKKPSKLPYYATTGHLRGWPHGKPRDGHATEQQPQVDQGHELDRQHLVDFETAAAFAAARRFDGVGFAFLPGDGLIGIDLDDVVGGDDSRGALGLQIANDCDTFGELSPSGTGLHLIGLGEVETFKSNDIGVEVFCGRQFFTMTGSHHPDTPFEVREIPEETLGYLRGMVEKAKEQARQAKEAARPAPAAAPAAPMPGTTAATRDEATRYCLAALDSAVQRLRSAREGGRNDLLNGEAFGLGQLLHTGGISEATVRAALTDAARSCGLNSSEINSTLRSGIEAGKAKPKAIPPRQYRAPAAPAPRPPAPPAIDPDTGEILDDVPPPANDNQAEEQPAAPAPAQAWQRPMDIFAEFPAPPIAADMLPEVVAAYAFECASLVGVEPGMIAVPALVACAAALHDGVKIQPKRHESGWTESARLWCAVVGPPSVKKSASISRATRRLRKIDRDMAQENARKSADHAMQMEAYKEAKKAAKKSGEPVPCPERPLMERVIVEDITVEALSEVLKDNSRGVLCVQDELSGWFGSMDAYTGGKAGNKDRAAWLQAYNGGFRQVDRVMRGSVPVPNFSVSMIGGIQPDAIRRIAKDMTDDGLMQRFMIIVGRNAREFDRAEDSTVMRAFADLVDHLNRVMPSNDPIRLTEEAHQVRERLCDYAAELADYPALPGGLRSHLGKWSGLFARLLLVFHAVECAGESIHPVQRDVSQKCAERVERLMRRFLLPHALAYYTDILGSNSDLDHARWVAGYILSRGLQTITNRDLVQAYKQWRGMDDWRRTRVMQVLEDMAWLSPLGEEDKRSRRAATSWAINPEVHDLFALRAEEEAERRARVRSEVQAMQTRA